jgi:hypothetical protein
MTTISGGISGLTVRRSEARPDPRPDRLLGWRHRQPDVTSVRRLAGRHRVGDLIGSGVQGDRCVGGAGCVGAFRLHDHILDQAT